jgi:cyanophycinase-like exopeptidase
MINKLGLIALLGSGETSAAGGLVFETLARRMESKIQIGILETPAGFELNTHRVAGRVAEYLAARLQNLEPHIRLIPARKRNSAFSPDDPDICAGILSSNLIFFGPGSPSYTVRQLKGSLAWDYIQARQRLGATITLASAATIALGVKALPVYEIYKVGEDPHWKDGLNFFAPFGLSLVIIPHWNNFEGGSDVDTSRCFIGRQRFEVLAAQLDRGTTILGLDEHTGLIIDLNTEMCQVLGKGEIHLITDGKERTFKNDTSFSIQNLGNYRPLAELDAGLDPVNWHKAQEASRSENDSIYEPLPPIEVMELLELRRQARLQKNWGKSDEIRVRISGMGWIVVDTPDGQKLQKTP